LLAQLQRHEAYLRLRASRDMDDRMDSDADEQSIYDGVIGGQINTAADLDALTLSILNKYEIWPALEPELAHTWTLKGLMMQDPLYLVNYLYSGLLATKMFDMLEQQLVDDSMKILEARIDALGAIYNKIETTH